MHPTIDESPLLRRMAEALSGVKRPDCVLHVSVASDSVWEKSPGGDDEVQVRWLCWSIESPESELLAPQFEVLSPSVTLEKLQNELPSIFRHIKVVVDNDIQV